MSDVARVELGAKSYDTSFALDNRPSVGLPIFQLPGANAFAHRPRDPREDAETPR